ncbi:MAG: hypothetical protein M3443_05600 [Actinomycetota bacterium]|nr:hypothetical protein [Actinomycetota bacterium]
MVPYVVRGVYGTISTPEKRAELRKRGVVQTLPSGALRARLYSGVDPLTGRRIYLGETPFQRTVRTPRKKQRALIRLHSQVDEKRAPRMQANVDRNNNLPSTNPRKMGYNVTLIPAKAAVLGESSRQSGSTKDA